MFQNKNYVWLNSFIRKYQRFIPLACKDLGIRKTAFMIIALKAGLLRFGKYLNIYISSSTKDATSTTIVELDSNLVRSKFVLFDKF